MNTLPSVLVLLDLSAVLAGKTREWQEFRRVGPCFLPEVVVDEIRTLADHAVEPTTEQTAREFLRFLPLSEWQITTARSPHPKLQPAAGHTLSKKARLFLDVAECAYGLTRSHPRSVVVLVSNDQPLLQRIRGLGVPNLSGISVASLLQWSRTQRRPAVVTHQMQLLRSSVRTDTVAATRSQPVSQPTPMPPTPTRRSSTRTVLASSPARTTVSVPSSRPGALSQIVSGLVALSIFLVLGAIGWRMMQPQQFDQFWRQLNLPPLPGLMR